ncbi:MAG: sigma-70 family RNA polymerase sigma factor [Polyangiaceae bacterium]
MTLARQADSTEPVSTREPSVEIPDFDGVYDQNVGFVWRSARRLGVGDHAVDDVVQQVFVVVHRRLSEFEGRSSLKTWLFSILLHAVREHRRSLRRKSPHWWSSPNDPELVEDGARNPEQEAERAEASRTIDRLLENLDGDKRVVFVMAELEQMTANEISEATGLDTKAVYSRLRAARIDFERAAEKLRKSSRSERSR